MDLHAPQVQAFFHIPVDDLSALPVLCEAIERKAFPNLVVVSPDAGFVKKARKFAQRRQFCLDH
jgi:ribose-phosphate pyrophosphokinase